jgi:NADH-quinone oxidoreductase subunit N
MNVLVQAMLPELILTAVACGLFLLGISTRAGARRLAPAIALVALLAVFWMELSGEMSGHTLADDFGTFRVFNFAHYVKMLTAGVGVLLVLLAWPTNRDATGNSALDFGNDSGEFFALMLLSIVGVFLVAGANDMILLFLGLELASIPTYIMVSMSRPIPAAQEAGVKYFFLGAMAAAVMLFGFSYLYGTTGSTSLKEITALLSDNGRQSPALTPWQQLAVVMLVAGFAFKIAAVPLHFYAGDVYQGAATPVTAFLSFVPKISGFVALIKLLHVVSGGIMWQTPDFLANLLWVLAVLTMTVGNVLGLLQFNVKRVLAYSSIAHSGYILVGLTVWAGVTAGNDPARRSALEGVLFYLAAYGIMNAAAFGVLMLLPARPSPFGDAASRRAQPATSAETFEDLAGTGRTHVGLGLAMAVSCFSLIGLPLTVGFWGKLMLIRAALQSGQTMMTWLVVITMINAAISAAYYLRIVATMFLRTDPVDPQAEDSAGATDAAAPAPAPFPIMIAVILSAGATLLFGILVPATELLINKSSEAANVDSTSFQNIFEDDEFESEDRVTEPAAAAAVSD